MNTIQAVLCRCDRQIWHKLAVSTSQIKKDLPIAYPKSSTTFVIELAAFTIKLITFTVKLAAFMIKLVAFTIKLAAFTVKLAAFTVKLTVLTIKLAALTVKLAVLTVKLTAFIDPTYLYRAPRPSRDFQEDKGRSSHSESTAKTALILGGTSHFSGV